MAGKIKIMIDKIISERAKGNATLAATTKTKLILKGIVPEKFGLTSPDDPAVIKKLQELALELKITL